MTHSGALNPSPRTLDVQSVAHFDRLIRAGAGTMHGWHAQSLDLRGRSRELNALEAQGAIFLGCTFDDGVEDSLRGRGALIFPKLHGVPFNPYRGGHWRQGIRIHPGRPRVPLEHPAGAADQP